jgi:allantoin racemase
LINIGPYQGAKASNRDEAGTPIVQELVDNMRRKGQLEGVEIDFDSGTTKPATRDRDDDVLTHISVGVLEKIREYSGMGKYDAIVCRGSLEPAFYAGREVSKIPVAYALHSAVHVASLIGEKFSIIEVTDAMAHIARRNVQAYGLAHKLTSVRRLNRPSVDMGAAIYAVKKAQRAADPEVRKILDTAMNECVAAVESEGADTIILGCTPLQYLEDELRERLDAAGYEEIQLVCEFSAAVEMAKAMVNMKLKQAPRAYPTDHLKAKPRYR